MRADVGTDTRRCGEQMANDMRRKSGRVCALTIGHSGAHASQYSQAGARAQMERAADKPFLPTTRPAHWTDLLNMWRDA